MNNILIDKLPRLVRVGDKIYKLETDFRAGISFALMVEAGQDDFFELCRPFFPEGLPDDMNGAVEAVLWFYHSGEKPEKETNKKEPPVYSYDVDREAIFADFWRFYNIDLSQEGLHWWAFRSLLLGLPEDSNFKNRIYYRTCDIKSLPKREQKRVSDIRKRIEIKTNVTGAKMTLEQRNKMLIDYVNKRTKEAKG